MSELEVMAQCLSDSQLQTQLWQEMCERDRLDLQVEKQGMFAHYYTSRDACTVRICIYLYEGMHRFLERNDHEQCV